MSQTRAIAHNTIIQLIGKVASTALGLIAIAMMTRYLGQEKFGWYVTTISFLQFIGILTDFGMTPVTAQMMSEPAWDKKKLLSNLLGFRLVSSIIFLGIAPFIALLFPYPHEVKIAIAFTTISFLAIALNQVFLGFYQTKMKMHVQALGEFAGRIALVIGIYFLIYRGSSFLPIMGMVTASSIIYTFVVWLHAKRETQISFGFDPYLWKAIAKKMWPIAISIIFNVIYLKGDVVILSTLVPQTEVGIYGAAYRVLDVMTQNAMMLMGLFLPLLAYAWSRNDKENFKKYFQQSFDAMMLLAVPLMMGTMVLAVPIIELVAGQKFTESGYILKILSIAVFGVFLGAVFGHAAVAINKQKQTMWIYISGAILTLIGYLYFIPRYGIYGAAWMSVFSELYVGYLLYAIIRKHMAERLQFKTLGKIIFASLVMSAVLLKLAGLNVILLSLVGAATYGVTLFAIGGVSKNTIREIISPKEGT